MATRPNAFDDLPPLSMMAAPVAAAPPPSGPNAFDDITPPLEVTKAAEVKRATWQDRVQATGSGINRGLANLVASPADALSNASDLIKAGAGAAYGALTPNDTSPMRTAGKIYPGGLYHYRTPQGIEEYSKNAPPPGATPVELGHAIPQALEVNHDASPVGGWLAALMNKAPNFTPTEPVRPDDTASRYLAAVGSAVPGAAIGAGTGSTAQTLARALMQTGKNTAAAAVPIVAGQAVGEARPFGENESANNAAVLAAQLMAGQVAPGAVAGLRGVIRGGEAGRQQMNANVDSFRALGADPTVGQAAGTRRMQFLESGLSKMPGSAGVMAKAAGAQAADIGEGANALASQLSPRGASPERAGRAIEGGVTDAGGFRDQFRDTAKDLYSRVDQHIPPDSPVPVSNTISILDSLAKPVPGATATSSLLLNPKVAQIRDAIQQDAGQGGTLPYQALSAIRTQVGSMLSGNELMSDVPRAQLKQLYGGISQDMEQQARNAGPRAFNAFSRASNYYKAGLDRLDTLQDIVNRGGPESMFNAALSGTRDGATRLRAVMQSIGPDEQKTVAATVLKRLGSATPGNQNDAGTVFSPQTFLTNWNRMSPEAKTALFDRFPNGLRAKIDNIASVAANLRDGSKVFNNPPGTAAATHQVSDLTKVLGAAGVAWHETGGWKVPASVVSSAAIANSLARAMTNPNVVNWAGRSTNFATPGQQAALIAAPANMSTPDRDRQRLINALNHVNSRN